MFFEERRPRPRISAKEKDALYLHQKGKCAGCGRKIPKDLFQVDHIRAFSRDGSDRLNNLQLLCATCNGRKGAGTMGQLKKRLQKDGAASAPKAKTAKKPTAKKVTTKKAAAKKPAKRKRQDPWGWL